MPITSVRIWSQRILGLYLTYHFLSLAPYAAEMFGATSWLTEENLPNKVFGFPFVLKSDAAISAYLVTLALSAGMLIWNRWTHLFSVYIWLGFIGLVSRNPFYYELTIDYLGWLCLSVAVLHWVKDSDYFFFQRAAWFVLGVGYLASGISKLESPHWTSGDAMSLFYASDILTRFQWLQLNEAASKTIGWSVILIEILFLPAIFHSSMRKGAWAASVLMHLGIATTTQLTEISLAMLVFHLFLFESSWIEDTKWLKKKTDAVNF